VGEHIHRSNTVADFERTNDRPPRRSPLQVKKKRKMGKRRLAMKRALFKMDGEREMVGEYRRGLKCIRRASSQHKGSKLTHCYYEQEWGGGESQVKLNIIEERK